MAKAKATAATAPAPSALEKAWAHGKLPRAVLLAGAESALREQALNGIRRAGFGVKNPDDDGGMNWVVLYAQTGGGAGEPRFLETSTILDEVNTRPLFGDPDAPKVVIVRGAEALFAPRSGAAGESGENPRDVLERNLDGIPEGSTLVIEVAQPGNLKTTRFYKWFAERGAVIDCESLRNPWGAEEAGSALLDELDKRALERGLEMDESVLLALTERCGQTLGVLEEELDKLALALHAGEDKKERVKVSEEQIEDICSDLRLPDAFEFAEACCDRDTRKALETLHRILSHGLRDFKKPTKIVTNEQSIAMGLLGPLTYKLAQLQDLQAALDAGEPEFMAYKNAKLFGPRQNAARLQLKKHNAKSLRAAQAALLSAQFELRGAPDKRAALEKMVWALKTR